MIPGVGWSRTSANSDSSSIPPFGGGGSASGSRAALRVAVEASLTKVVVEVVASRSRRSRCSPARLPGRGAARGPGAGPGGHYIDLIVLANRTDADWGVLATVGLDETTRLSPEPETIGDPRPDDPGGAIQVSPARRCCPRSDEARRRGPRTHPDRCR